MVIFDQISDGRRYFGAIPSHNQHLTNGPIRGGGVLVSCGRRTHRGGLCEAIASREDREDGVDQSTYHSRSCQSGSSSPSCLAMMLSPTASRQSPVASPARLRECEVGLLLLAGVMSTRGKLTAGQGLGQSTLAALTMNRNGFH